MRAVDSNYALRNGQLTFGGGASAPDARPSIPRVAVYEAKYFGFPNRGPLDISDKVRAQCQEDQGACAFRCGDDSVGDSGAGPRPMCRIEYACSAGSRHIAIVREGDTLRVRCP